MKEQSAKQGLLSMGGHRADIELAAEREAARAGHAEVGFEHLLLGALVIGGPGARLLMDAGLDLTGARAAIDAVLREDLALLDIDLSGATLPAGGDETVGLPRSERVSELLVDCPWSGGDVALIAALIDDGGGRVRRLLEHAGTDPDQLRAGLDDLSPAPLVAAEPVPGAVPEGWDGIAVEAEVPVSADRLWALVRDPERRGEWDPARMEARVVGEGVVELVSPGRPPLRETLTLWSEGQDLTWSRSSGEHRQELRVTVEPLGDRARLRLDKRWPSAILHRRIANRLLRWFVRKQMRIQIQVITQVAA
ncbi:Clp protease N-terminal domain-containing protein [Nocardiopsis sp. NPDC007018]|uniref:SRPBCC family protein n=1 Tax=Nocardiopsis sp. NPDC007018 TaxID=3155721 RepID=UPI0033F48BFF